MTSVTAAEPFEWMSALELFYSGLARAARDHQVLTSLDLLYGGEIRAEGLLVVREGRRIGGVLLAVPLEGAAGLLLPPRVRGEADLERENLLVRAGLDFLRSRGAKVVHSILPDLSSAAPLVRGGMDPITHLFYFQHDLLRLPALPNPAWQLRAFDPLNPSLFQQTLLRTYQQSLDCPELNDTRTVEEILAGHRAQGILRPDHWQLALVQEVPVGLILLCGLKDEPAWDLSYVGVVPERRGQGWGRALVSWGLQAAKEAGVPGLHLAVDERNEPALGLYRSLGFVEVARRVVLLLKLEGSAASAADR